MIVSDQCRMLNSILERPERGCMIEKVLVENQRRNSNPTLASGLAEVKAETRNYFIKQFRKRKHGFDEPHDWENEYKPKS